MDKELLFEMEELLNELSELEMDETKKKKIERIKEIMEPTINKAKEKIENNRDWTFENYNPQQQLQQAINILTNAMKYHQAAALEEEKYNREQQDILHAFELIDMSEEDLVKYGKEIMKLRHKRRVVKNFIEVIAPFYNYVTNNRQIIKELGRIQSQIQNAQETVKEKKYTVKEKTNMQEAFDKAKASDKEAS